MAVALGAPVAAAALDPTAVVVGWAGEEEQGEGEHQAPAMVVVRPCSSGCQQTGLHGRERCVGIRGLNLVLLANMHTCMRQNLCCDDVGKSEQVEVAAGQLQLDVVSAYGSAVEQVCLDRKCAGVHHHSYFSQKPAMLMNLMRQWELIGMVLHVSTRTCCSAPVARRGTVLLSCCMQPF